MADLNLDTCSLAELKQLQKDVARAIATFEERQKAEARLKLDSLAREMGYSRAARRNTGTRRTRH
jgi:DNA-binding protein H-NS